MNHVFRAEDGIEVFLGEDAVFEYEVVYAATGFEGFLRNLGRIFVADNRVQGSYHADAVVYFVAAAFFVGGDAVYSAEAKGVEAVNHQVYRFEAALCHDWFHGVQFHLSGVAGHGYAEVVTHYLVAYLAHHFRDNRIYLTRHD